MAFKLKPFELSEEQLQIMCADWIESQYKELTELFYFHSFLGMRLPMWAIVKAKKSGGLKANILDFQFNKNNGKYSGLFIELKKESPYLKSGELKKDEHLEKQNNTINLLRLEGHYSCFCWSLNQFKQIVTDYMECRL